MISRSYVYFSILYLSLENGSRVFFGFLIMCYEIAISFYTGNHPFRSLAKFSQKLILITPLMYTHIYAQHKVRNASFSEKICVRIKWMLLFLKYCLIELDFLMQLYFLLSKKGNLNNILFPCSEKKNIFINHSFNTTTL